MKQKTIEILAIIAFIVALLLPRITHCDDSSALRQYVQWVFRDSSATRLRKALLYVPLVEREARNQNWDPLLIGVNITEESGWKANIVSKSRHRERGLMQVHGVAARGFDLSSPRGQIRAGVTWLSRGRIKCGNSLPSVLSYYMTGSCNQTNLPAVKRRLRKYENAKRRFR